MTTNRNSDPQSTATPPPVVIYLLFFLSGAAGLMYETLWLRRLALDFGATAPATATILAIFLGGLGLGALLFGRFSRRLQRPLRWYGLIELAVACCGLLSPWLLTQTGRIFLNGPATWELSPMIAMFFRALLVIPALLPAAVLMGGTLPILTRALTTDPQQFSRRVGHLYGWNTAGAVAGIFLTLYILLPGLGVTTSIELAAGVNVLVGLIMLILARREQTLTVDPALEVQAAPAPVPGLFIFLFALSGLAAMVLEVGWTRLLTPLSGSSVYAFGVMLGGFLLGLASGSLVGARWSRHCSSPLPFFLTLIGFGASALLTLPFFPYLPNVIRMIQQIWPHSFFGLQLEIFLISAILMFPATFFSGMALPLLLPALMTQKEESGAVTGRLYAWNTFGGIVGSLAAGFYLLPSFGVHPVILATALLLLFFNAFAILSLSRITFWKRALLISLILLLALVGWRANTHWNPKWQTFALDAVRNGQIPLTTLMKRFELLFQQEGINANVSVHQSTTGQLSLAINGRTNASNGVLDMRTQLLLGHLPLVYAPDTSSALLIGLGSGITLGAMATYGIRQLECAELEPLLLNAARYFHKENRDVLDNPDVKIHAADGRNFLLASRQSWDVIVSEPSHLWAAGTANLYTEDFFQACRKHLTPKGVFCQWFHAYQLHPSEVRLLINTFLSVFPDGVMWYSMPGDMMLLGGPSPMILDGNRLQSLWENNADFRNDLISLNIQTPDALTACFLLDPERLAVAKTGMELKNTDDLPLLEFFAPRGMLQSDYRSRNFNALQRLGRTAELPAVNLDPVVFASPDHQLHLARAWKTMEMYRTALAACEKGLKVNPEYLPLRQEAAELLLKLDKPREAMQMLEKYASSNTAEAELFFVIACAGRQLGNAELIYDNLKKAIKKAPDNPDYHGAMADLYFDAKDYEQAMLSYRVCLKLREDSPRDDNDRAMGYLLGKIGYCAYRLQDYLTARKSLEDALRWETPYIQVYQTLGDVCFAQKDFVAAAEAYQVTLTLDKDNEPSRIRLWQSLKKCGKTRQAQQVFDELMERRPFHPEILRELQNQSSSTDRGNGR